MASVFRTLGILKQIRAEENAQLVEQETARTSAQDDWMRRFAEINNAQLSTMNDRELFFVVGENLPVFFIEYVHVNEYAPFA